MTFEPTFLLYQLYWNAVHFIEYISLLFLHSIIYSIQIYIFNLLNRDYLTVFTDSLSKSSSN